MNPWNPERIKELMLEAGRIALRYYESPDIEQKKDRSLVTAADKEIEAFFADRFDRPAAGDYLIGEETIGSFEDEYLHRALAERAWIVDPIDGTAAYAHHLPHWAISLALAENGRIREGAVLIPLTGELFVTSPQGIVFGEGLTPLPVRRAAVTDAGMIAISQVVAKRGRIELANPVQALSCAVLPLVYLTLGRFLAYIGKVKLWDAAASLAILSRAGFTTCFPDGTVVDERIAPDLYRLDRADPGRWEFRQPLVAGPGPGAVEYLLAGASLT